MSRQKRLPDLWLEGSEGERVARAPCGCRVIRDHLESGDPAFYYCSLHNAAAEMFEVCKQIALASGAPLTEAKMISLARRSRRAIARVRVK